MSSKYTRYKPVVDVDDSVLDRNDVWYSRLQKEIMKNAVVSKETDRSLFDQINHIMNGRSRYSSVDEAVAEMQERSGLSAYLQKESATDEDSVNKTAEVHDLNEYSEPEVFKINPNIKTYINNYAESTNGNLPIMAILEKVKGVYGNEIAKNDLWENENILKYISKVNGDIKSQVGSVDNYESLGKVDFSDDSDPSNTDAFHGLMPNVASDNNYYKLGSSAGQYDLKKYGFGSDVLSSILATDIPPNSTNWIEYCKGYFEGANLKEEDREFEGSRVMKFLSSKLEG